MKNRTANQIGMPHMLLVLQLSLDPATNVHGEESWEGCSTKTSAHAILLLPGFSLNAPTMQPLYSGGKIFVGKDNTARKS